MFYIPVLLLLIAAPHNEIEEEVLKQDSNSSPLARDEKTNKVSRSEKEAGKDIENNIKVYPYSLERKLRARIMADAPIATHAPLNPLINPDAAMFDTYNPQAFSDASSGKQTAKTLGAIAKQKTYIIAVPPRAGVPTLFPESYSVNASDASDLLQQLIITDWEGYDLDDESEEEDEEK